ncbi:MAG: class I SAM-dependent methyltransferase [Candidatus Hodarchaeales archaeon]
MSKEEVGKLGLYEFQGYIGAMTSPTFGGWKGTDKLIEFLDIKELMKPKILEVGCSTGYITIYVAQQFDCEITGIDLSDLVIKIAQEKAEKLNLTNISFEVANVEKLPFSDNSFDIIYGEAITALVPDPIKVIKEYKRVLKPGGKIATLDVFMKESIREETIDEINEIMTKVIGTKVRIRTLREWEQIYQETGLHEVKMNDYYEDIFKRGYSVGEMVKIIGKMSFHMITNKKVRKKLFPTLKFARKFQREIAKSKNFGYLIFTGSY